MKYRLNKGKLFKTGTKISYLATAVSLIIASPQAIANDEISYNYLEAGYFQMNDSGIEPKGYFLKGSLEISDSFFMFAESKQGEANTENLNMSVDKFDFDRFGFGIGYQSDLTKNSSWFVSYSINEWDFETDNWDVDIFRVGVRGQLTDNLELNASLTRYNFDYGMFDQDESGYQLGMAYDITDSVSFTANYDDIDGVDETSVGIRFEF